MTPVTMAPTSTPRMGLEKRTKRLVNQASSCRGATARRVKTQEEFEKAFADALKSKTPFVIDCIIDSDDKVWPMVAPGKPINESFDEEDYNATQGGN